MGKLENGHNFARFLNSQTGQGYAVVNKIMLVFNSKNVSLLRPRWESKDGCDKSYCSNFPAFECPGGRVGVSVVAVVLLGPVGQSSYLIDWLGARLHCQLMFCIRGERT